MANGIGAFLSGAVEGYDKGLEQNRRQQEEQRRKLEFDYQQQQRELEIKVRDETAKSLADLEARYTAPRPEGGIQDPNAPEPMSEPEYYYNRAKIVASAGVRLGKVSAADEKALREAGREMKFDNFREAVKHAYANPDDVAGIQKRLKKSGVNVPEGMQFRTVSLDPNDPQSDRDLVGFVVGQDGKEQQVFSYMNTLPMFATSDVLTQDALDTRKGLRAQRFQSREKAMDRTKDIDVASITSSSRGKDPEGKVRELLIRQLYEIPEGRFKAQLGNAANALTPELFEQSRNEMLKDAEDLVLNKGVPPYRAFVLATESQRRDIEKRKGAPQPKK